MQSLDQDVLFKACRAIYEMAGSNFILPPLTRKAEMAGEQSKTIYHCRFGSWEFRFSASLDETYADRNARPNARLPIKFQVEASDTAGLGALELSGREQRELIRAFLLGAKAPISVEKLSRESGFRVSLQLASTFSVECGELMDAAGGRVPKDICDGVAHEIYERSKDFFEGAPEGLAVWSARAAQDLFGEARPAPESYWPIAAPSAEVALWPIEAALPTKTSWRTSRCSIAACLLAGLTLPAFLALGLALHTLAQSADPTPAPHQAPQSLGGAFSSLPVAMAPPQDTLAARRDGDRSDKGETAVFVALASVSGISLGALLPASESPAEPPVAKRSRPVLDKAGNPAHVAAAKAQPKIKAAGLSPKPDAKHRPSPEPTLGRRAVVALSGVFNGIKRIPMQIASLIKPQTTPR